GTARGRAPRSAQRLAVGHDRLRSGARRPSRRGGHHRVGLQLARHRHPAPDRDPATRLRDGAGHRPLHQRHVHSGQSLGRYLIRVPRPAHSLTMTATTRRAGAVDFLRRMTRNRLALFGAVVILIMVFAAIFAPWIAPYDPEKQYPMDALKPPSRQYLFGTD